MTDRKERAPSAFRLNLEQQKNRAKDLLRAVQAGDPVARARLTAIADADAFKLAHAQLAIARELRFASWAKLKAHIEAMDRQRAAIDENRGAPDAEMKTLHIRCGSDIQTALTEGGFHGDFLEHSIPYSHGPVTTGSDRYELMARFLVDAFPEAKGGLVYEHELEGLKRGEQRLHRTADEYERVVLWMEHDSYDQLVLLRLLAHYAQARRPRVLELIAVNEFPGAERFIGIGQLPAEALRLLWATRKPVTNAQLSLGNDAWNALASENPQRLAAIARSGTSALPILAPALHRHLRELPSVENGLSFTEHLLLQILSEGSVTLNRVFLMMNAGGREPLPWMGDLGLLHVVDDMLKVSEPVLIRRPPPAGERWFRQQLAITETGLSVLRGARDWHSLQPPPRWVGGVHIQPGASCWRWNEAKREPLWRER